MDTLTQNLTFFQNFLERYSGRKEVIDLEGRITAAAYATEDVIDSHIVDQIHSGSEISTVALYQGLVKAIQDRDSLKKEVMEDTFKEIMGVQLHDELPRNLRVRPGSMRQSSNMIEFDGVLIKEMLHKLTAHKSSRQVIPIVGMGGIGKTSLAQSIFSNPLIVDRFDILVWVTISNVYSVPEILSLVLSPEKEKNEEKLGERVHKKLWHRMYLIVMDDIWSIEAWDKVNSFFPDNDNGSRVMKTTRLSKLALDISGSLDFQINFLDENKSWDLFRKTMERCGIELDLEHIGKEIASKCKGLPLSIVVIGGILKNSNMERTTWLRILENLGSVINLEDDEYCLQILRTSYEELPIHLKSCFLYMGIFPENDEIHVSDLIKLWVAEGILRPSDEKSLEKVAEGYIMELVQRNLILVYEICWNGEVKLCRIHDLLRDLCLREAKKQRFLCAIKDQRDLNVPQCMNMERRICIHDDIGVNYSSQFFHVLKSASLNRSFILKWGWDDLYSSLSYRLLRVFSEVYRRSRVCYGEAIFQNVNLRYLKIRQSLYIFPSSCNVLWNLQTIKVDNPYYYVITAPSEIWEMFQLRHVMIANLQLPEPRCAENDIILEDLHVRIFALNLRRVCSWRIRVIWLIHGRTGNWLNLDWPSCFGRVANWLIELWHEEARVLKQLGRNSSGMLEYILAWKSTRSSACLFEELK